MVGQKIACLDCKILYYLGYGSYGTWIDADSVDEFDSKAKKVVGRDSDDPWTEHGKLRKNQNLRKVLVDHAGHRLIQWCDDAEYGSENGVLYMMGSYGTRGEPILEDYGAFKHV